MLPPSLSRSALLRWSPATGCLALALLAAWPEEGAAQEQAPAPKADPAKYLGQEPVGLEPEVFAPGLLSLENRYEYGIAISADGREVYFGVADGPADIRFLEYADGAWSKDQRLLPGATFSFNDPFLSKDEQRLYFISDLALSGQGRKRDHDIWFVQRKEEGWSKPIHAGSELNTPFEEYFVSLTDKGTLYFGSNRPDQPGSSQGADFDLYTSPTEGESFGKATRLPAALNTRHYEADVFVAPDESYVIFCATRPDGLGRGDLYISFRGPDGKWTPSKSMGETINTRGHELCPFVSRDGKYFFYTSREDIYWVDAKLLESYR